MSVRKLRELSANARRHSIQQDVDLYGDDSRPLSPDKQVRMTMLLPLGLALAAMHF
jgi:hypothetical protein